MYYPLLRGKQYELIAIRELAKNTLNFKPIIEVVRDNFSQIEKAVKILNENNIEPIIIANPSVGPFKDEFIVDQLKEIPEISYKLCYRVNDSNLQEILKETDHFRIPSWAWLDSGPSKSIINAIKDAEATIIDHSTPSNISALLNKVVLIGDFFDKHERNADYPPKTGFSYLHSTWNKTDNAIGFSDYTLMPKAYREGGGPAYVVTIHLSYIDNDEFDEMFVKHFSSDDDGSAANPAAKFLEALSRLIQDIEEKNVFIYSTAIEEFKSLSEKSHFPGLGYIKKLSIKHHIETISDYLKGN